jgi:hypothetical protein
MPDRTLEQGDLFFAFRRRIDAHQVASLRDVQRFYLITASHQPRERFRVFIVGRKHLPEPGIERGWAFNALTSDDAGAVARELSGKTYLTRTRGERQLPHAELAGEGAYRLILRDDRSELVYALDGRGGPLQRELGIHREGRLIIAARNPDLGRLGGGRDPEYPDALRERFGSHRWLPIDDLALLEAPHAQVVLIAAGGGELQLDPGDRDTRAELAGLLGSHPHHRHLALDPEPGPEERKPLKVICPICAEGFETRSAFERHLLAAHPPRAPSASDLMSALKGVHFPLDREQLLDWAEHHPTDPRVIDLLRALPPRQFRNVTDVTKALGELKSRPPG